MERSWDKRSAPTRTSQYISAGCAATSRVVNPRALRGRTNRSTASRRRCRFFTTCGSSLRLGLSGRRSRRVRSRSAQPWTDSRSSSSRVASARIGLLIADVVGHLLLPHLLHQPRPPGQGYLGPDSSPSRLGAPTAAGRPWMEGHRERPPEVCPEPGWTTISTPQWTILRLHFSRTVFLSMRGYPTATANTALKRETAWHKRVGQ
jgi:hypothetical protein